MLILVILISAVALLIWNGSNFFQRLSFAQGEFSAGLKLAWIALFLNIALILFGWRRYVDLQQEELRRRETEQRAIETASSDGMTGLRNRKGFADEGEALRANAVASGERLAIIAIQLNRFKTINDRHGPDVGDAVIRRIAVSVGEGLPAKSVAARVSGDEFAIAMTLSEAGVAEVEEHALRLLHAVTRPIEEHGKLIQVGAYVGIAVAASGEGSVADLLRRADIAMDHARKGRSARPVWFDAGMERALVIDAEIEQGIRFGLEHDQFVPYFEPQIDFATGAICGFEVLARWDHPLTGIVPPDRFIPIAEEHGLIGRMCDQIFRKALIDSARWDPSITISLNISPTQLADSWLAQKIIRLLAETGFPAERLVIEITESSLFADLDQARTIVTSLQNQGIRLALDDFGSGFSSLAHLRSLPFDIIKIDRGFVASIHDRESAAIVRAVTTLAQAIGVPVTVEGIEDAATHQAVIGLGCAIGQGWYFGKAMSAEDAVELLRQSAPPTAVADPAKARKAAG